MTALGLSPVETVGWVRERSNSAVLSEPTMRLESCGTRRQLLRFGNATFCALLTLTLLAATTPSSIGAADAARYLKDIQVLAAPNMEGRGPGTKGLEKASKYIEHRYKSLGLQPAGTDGYLQPFTVTTGAKLKSDNELVVINGGKQTAAQDQSGFRAHQLFGVGQLHRSGGVCRLRRDRG